MARFKKQILRQDRTYHSPDGEIQVTPETKRHWAAKVKQLVAKGFQIPTWWDHQDDPRRSKPIKFKDGKRRRAKGQAGWLTDANITDDGALEIELEIPGKDSKQVAENLTKVSPVIWEKLKDGEGEQHENIIGAMDLVVHPVDNTQSDFEPVEHPVAASITRFSLDNEPTVYRLGDIQAPEPGDDEVKAPKEGDGDRLGKVIAALASMKIVLSDDTNAENFMEHLEQALLTAASLNEDSDMANAEDTKPEVAQLSLEQKAIIDNAKRAQKFAEKQHREDVIKRLSLLLESGRCTPAENEQWTESAGAVSLSLNDDGSLIPSQVEAFITSREAVPEGTFWSDEQRTAKLSLQDTEHPNWTEDGVVTDEEADQIVNSVFKRNV